MYTIPYIESDEFFYLDVFLKLLLGLLALALIINKSGKGQFSAHFSYGSGTKLCAGGYYWGCYLQSFS